MQPTADPYRPAIDAVADVLARTRGGAAATGNPALDGLCALVTTRLRATPQGAQALTGLEQAPTSEPARAAAAAALAAAGFADPALPHQLHQWLAQLPVQAPGAPPSTPAGFAPPPRRNTKAIVLVVIVVVVLLLLLCGGVVAGIVILKRINEPDDITVQDWRTQAEAIEGIVDYRGSRPDLLSPEHQTGTIDYEITPPFGGPHHYNWQNCEGAVYDEPIADEHAVHSLEHGAVWVTYDPSLSEAEVERLAERVRGTNYAFMSPYPGIDAPVSLQAWGFQLKVQDVEDPRIDEFIRVLRINASQEPGAPCGGGVTTTGTTPVD